jgi:hypothetical protein
MSRWLSEVEAKTRRGNDKWRVANGEWRVEMSRWLSEVEAKPSERKDYLSTKPVRSSRAWKTYIY